MNNLPKIFLELANLFSDNGFNLYMVGGTSRDYLLNKEILDFDFATDATLEEMEKFLQINTSFSLLGSTTINYNGNKVDITTLRKEEGYYDSRHPSKVEFVKETALDYQRRDFTINAIYIDKYGNIIDHCNGKKDLENQEIRMIGDVEKRMKEDPLRMLRAIRFSLILGFKLHDNIVEFINTNKMVLRKINFVKCAEEIEKMKLFSEKLAINVLEKYEIDKVIPIEFNFKNPLNCIDMHCDSLTWELVEKNGFYENKEMHIDFKRLYKGEYLMQCFAVFMYYQRGDLYKNTLKYIDIFKREMENNKNIISQVTSYKELMDNKSKHKLSALLTIEEGGVIEGSIEKLEHLYSLGVRMICLTWNFKNEIGYPNLQRNLKETDYYKIDTVNGLTEFGIEVVKKMNELGIIIDTSHLSDAGFYDCIKYSKHPIVASHSNSRRIHPYARNMTDDMILKLHENKGVMGMNYCPDFVSENTKENQIKDIVKHMLHIKELGCIDNLALGSDFDGIETPVGMSDCTKTHELREEMVRSGFTNDEIEKVFYKNFLRVFKQVCKK